MEPSSLPFAIAIPSCPVTEERKPWYPPENSLLQTPGTARANLAPDENHPHGTTKDSYAQANHNRTVLQQHCDYWDTDGDGVIWPQDTYAGCRRFGWSPPLAFVAALIINLGLSYATCPTFIPDPFFRIYLDRIHKAKHGSDSVTYDKEGRYRPQQFEEIFSKYDRGNKGGLTKADVWEFLQGQRLLYDFFGATAVTAEWVATYLLLWPEDGMMRKEDLRGIYDGSIFYKKAEEFERKQKGKAASKKLH